VFLRSGPSLLPRGEYGPTLEALNRVDPNAVAPASNASNGGRSETPGNGGPENVDQR
jgi:hypothetical protein